LAKEQVAAPLFSRKEAAVTMKALMLNAAGSLALADVDLPQVGPGEARIRIAACGICGSDVHGYGGRPAGAFLP